MSDPEGIDPVPPVTEPVPDGSDPVPPVTDPEPEDGDSNPERIELVR